MRRHLPLAALFLTLLIIHPDPGGGVAPPEPRRWQQGPWPAACRQPLRLVAVAPNPRQTGPDGGASGPRQLVASHEWVAVLNPSPIAAPLDGWTLRTGRGRRGRLPPLTVGPGATQLLPIGPEAGLKLADSGGTLHLLDPCGQARDRFSWQETPEGVAHVRDAWLSAGAGTGEAASAVALGRIEARSLDGIERLLKGPRVPWQAARVERAREGAGR
jgi:hypothetical protein